MGTAAEDPLASPTIAGTLRRRAVRQPDRVAFTHLISDSDSESVTYAELDRRAAGIAAWLLARGVHDQRILLVHPTGLDFIASFFGCLYAGAQPVPQSPFLRPRNLQKLAAVAADCGAAIALTDSATIARLAAGERQPAGLDWIASGDIPRAPAGAAVPLVETPHLAYLQYTSGSTAEPRGVRITQANLMAHLRQLIATYEANDGDVVVTWLPHFHDMGLVGMLLTALYFGAPCVILSTLHVMQRPLRWLKAISDHRGTFSAAPNFAYEMCITKITSAERQTLDLSRWRVALNGAEPVRAETIRRFTSAFAANGLRGEAISPCYGLAEATLMVSSSRLRDHPRITAFDRESLRRHKPQPASGDNAIELTGCGPPNDDLHVAIVDPDTRAPAAAGTVGEIWVKGDSVADGYFAAPEASAATFGARLADGSGPYLRTGDLGFFHEGELFIAGRAKDLIIAQGRNLYPHDIEQSVQLGRPALIAGRGAAFAIESGGQERLVLVQELHRHAAGEAAALITQIRAAILGDFDIHASAVLLVNAGSLPVTSSGKLARHAARDMFLAGELTPLAAWYGTDWPPSGPQNGNG
jgi:acyl-CoA synthetase (AMP-forming)/AMP-acid ligase II